VRAGAPEFADYHLERLARGAATLRLPPPDLALMAREIASAATTLEDGALKLIVTRGSAERGYRIPRDARPRRILLAYDPATHPATWASEGIRVRLCSTRLGRNPRLAGLKHLNRLEQVLGRSEWQDPTVAEGLMMDEDDHVVCATSANLFVVRGAELVTPSVELAGVAGVMRRVVMELAARADIVVSERVVHRSELDAASELMLSNSLVGLWRVRELEGRALPGDATWRRLRAALAACAGKAPR
jgi:4-amino-4-deoxychorismate lyase